MASWIESLPDNLMLRDFMDRVLIVDDEELARTLIGEILEEQGYQCTLAADADEARSCLMSDEFAVVLSDFHMPGENGLELLEDVLGRYPATVGIIVSSNTDPELREKARDIGVYAYVTKPVQAEGFVKIVSRAVKLVHGFKN